MIRRQAQDYALAEKYGRNVIGIDASMITEETRTAVERFAEDIVAIYRISMAVNSLLAEGNGDFESVLVTADSGRIVFPGPIFAYRGNDFLLLSYTDTKTSTEQVKSAEELLIDLIKCIESYPKAKKHILGFLGIRSKEQKEIHESANEIRDKIKETYEYKNDPEFAKRVDNTFTKKAYKNGNTKEEVQKLIDYLQEKKKLDPDPEPESERVTEPEPIVKGEGTGNTDIQRMMDNVKNDTSLGLTDIKKQTIIGIGRAMLEEGYESAFVAGMLANIIHEGTAGLFESSNYASNPAAKPQYLVHMDNKYNYRSEYSGQNIMNKNLSDVYNILVQLEADNWKKGKFGLGSVQWTGGRTKTLVETYMEVAGASDKITFDQMLKAEGLMISRELSGNYGYIYSDWLSANSGNLNSANAAYSSGYNLCTKYEIPANYTTKAPNRANTAKLLYEIMTGK